MRYSFRVFLLNLGFIGDEFKNYRPHLLKHIYGNIAWRHPAYLDYRKHGKLERTPIAIIFGGLLFSLTAPLYIWTII
ncbi:DUF3852 family protein [Ruminococcus albus]|uniref:DUF3852 family protein n=1 Tax=Ruminococcus albus TaxID=1264 RepID=UPI001FA7F275|nr:DUF3852 family protein [Ruminococcus albus]